jgi:hypothetical protein
LDVHKLFHIGSLVDHRTLEGIDNDLLGGGVDAGVEVLDEVVVEELDVETKVFAIGEEFVVDVEDVVLVEGEKLRYNGLGLLKAVAFVVENLSVLRNVQLFFNYFG